MLETQLNVRFPQKLNFAEGTSVATRLCSDINLLLIIVNDLIILIKLW